MAINIKRLFSFFRKKTVLVVDDEPVLVEMVSSALEQKGYRVLTAQDGSRGLSIAVMKRPSLVILDIKMPGNKDGWDVLTALRATPTMEKTPVIMLTSLDQVQDVSKCFVLGATGYIPKPLDIGKLYKKVKELIG